jgi:hypothetical protein
MRLWWNTGDKVNPKYAQKDPSQPNIFVTKFHMGYSAICPTFSVKGPETSLLNHGTNFSDCELRMLSPQTSDQLV